jgi:hypothetical protein
MALMKCSECGSQLSDKAKSCPSCGSPPRRKTSSLTWFVTLLFGLTGAVTVVVMIAADGQGTSTGHIVEEHEPKQNEEELHLIIGAGTLRKSMKNPSSFELEMALLIDGARTACYSYRGRNSFNAVVPGQAVFIFDTQRLMTNNDEGFAKEWNGRCANKPGTDYTHRIRLRK